MPEETSPASLSPSVKRTVAVLNFLAEHPDQAFTLSEIAKSLKISSATCHGLLAALAEEGFIYRTVGKTYVLGPALARAGRAALHPGLVMQVIRPEMRALADSFDVICSAYRLIGDEVMIWERAAALSHVNWSAQKTLVVPIAAPLGGIFMAWRTPADIENWMAEATPPLDAAARDRLHASLRFLRVRGFGFGERTVPLENAETARALQNQTALTDYAGIELEPDRDYQLAFVAAPVIARPGKIAFGLSLAGFVRPMKGAEVAAIGERLQQSCARLAAFLDGRHADEPLSSTISE